MCLCMYVCMYACMDPCMHAGFSKTQKKNSSDCCNSVNPPKLPGSQAPACKPADLNQDESGGFYDDILVMTFGGFHKWRYPEMDGL